jgi:hypothetical protein
MPLVRRKATPSDGREAGLEGIVCTRDSVSCGFNGVSWWKVGRRVIGMR